MKNVLLSLLYTLMIFAILLGIGAIMYYFPYVVMGIILIIIAIGLYISIFNTISDKDNEDDYYEGW